MERRRRTRGEHGRNSERPRWRAPLTVFQLPLRPSQHTDLHPRRPGRVPAEAGGGPGIRRLCRLNRDAPDCNGRGAAGRLSVHRRNQHPPSLDARRLRLPAATTSRRIIQGWRLIRRCRDGRGRRRRRCRGSRSSVNRKPELARSLRRAGTDEDVDARRSRSRRSRGRSEEGLPRTHRQMHRCHPARFEGPYDKKSRGLSSERSVRKRLGKPTDMSILAARSTESSATAAQPRRQLLVTSTLQRLFPKKAPAARFRALTMGGKEIQTSAVHAQLPKACCATLLRSGR